VVAQSVLDLGKAFDSVNYSKLYCTFLKAGILEAVADIIHCWYSKLFGSVRGNYCLSNYFHVPCDVLEGSLVSVNLFSIFINMLIVQLKFVSLMIVCAALPFNVALLDEHNNKSYDAENS
jgi:hypothetical protein